MNEKKRFAIKPQDNYWAVIDNHNDDKVCIINGIHTEIEAIWLCDFMNEQQSMIEDLTSQLEIFCDDFERVVSENSVLQKENEKLRKENFFLAKQRNYWKDKCGVAVETFEIDEATAKKISELEEENEQLKSELNDCAVILYSVCGEMNYLNYKSDPVILKKYKELFDDV